MRELAEFVCDELRADFPKITYELTKRAILFEFHEPMDDEDPSVDLVVCLTRREEPGFWIPNRVGPVGPRDPHAADDLAAG
jgi:hypothetical protein